MLDVQAIKFIAFFSDNEYCAFYYIDGPTGFLAKYDFYLL